MDCHNLRKDVERLEQELNTLDKEFDVATREGAGKNKVTGVIKIVSTTCEALLPKYYHDIRIHNLDDPNHRNAEFLRHLNSLLPETKNPLPREITIDEVRNNLEKYLEDDPGLDSNLLTFALKERVIKQLAKIGKLNQGETLSSITSTVQLQDIIEILKDIYVPILSKIEGDTSNHAVILTILAERVKNLETYETKHYIFMLPKDKWDDNRIPLPPNDEGTHIAPTDLTAILKEPVRYDWGEETNGEVTKDPFHNELATLVYDENWVGQEIRHFPWCKELFGEEGANEKLLKSNGYHVPKEWGEIIDAIKNQCRQENGINPSNKDFTKILVNNFGLESNGQIVGASFVARSNGFFWSSKVLYSNDFVYVLDIGQSEVSVHGIVAKCDGEAVRCLATS